jgi:hypothetical protein
MFPKTLRPGYIDFAKFCNFHERFKMRNPISLIASLGDIQNFLALDARDRVFVLLGLVYNGAVFVPNPNYSLLLQNSQISKSSSIQKEKSPTYVPHKLLSETID